MAWERGTPPSGRLRTPVEAERQRIQRIGVQTMKALGTGLRTGSIFGVLALVFSVAPELALAQTSPFLTGANSLQTNILAWATPIAVILVMALGIMAMANRISWGWPMAAMVGIAVVFGAPQMVTWIRGMFGV